MSKSTAGTDGLKKVAEYTYDYRDLVVCRNADEYFEYTPEGTLIYDGRPSPNSDRDYVYANGSVWCELTGAGNVFYHHTDHLGTTEYMTDAAGTVVWQCEYESFGKVIKKSGSKASSFKPMYTGKQMDESTGLYYFNARWYDPEQGRFISQDPARDGVNWWIYCRNNPLTYVDPSGLTTLDDFAYQKETSGDWSHKETSVYQQRAAEANREYSPVNIQQSTNLPGEENYVQKINDARLAEIIQIQKSMGYDFNVMGLDQKTVGERLGINGKAACLVTIWMKAYVFEGATVEQAYKVMENEVKNGRISKDKSYMNDQLMTSENLAKSLKGKNYDKSFLQSPWIDGKQVTYNSIDDFRNSNYKYAFIKYSSKRSSEFHYTLLVNMNGYISEHDPWPGGINSLSTWKERDVTLESIEPKGWYKR